jgi:hypothetical protein
MTDRVTYQRDYMRNYRRCRGHRPFVEALTMQELEQELNDILRIESIELFPWYQEVLRRCQSLEGSVSFPNLPRALAPRPQYRARKKALE